MTTQDDINTIDKDILRLALPTLGALLIEPVLVATDTIMVGHLGTDSLAGLSLSSTILSTIVGLCIFLAYATTASTARFMGAGKIGRALRYGVDGIWLALLLGVILGALLAIFSPSILGLFGAEGNVITQGNHYVRFSSFGLPGMLLVLAATGTLRGLGDTRTPFHASLLTAVLNIPLNYIFIYPSHMGVAGAALGTAIAQTVGGLFLTAHIIRRCRVEKVSLTPRGAGVLGALNNAIPLMMRTVILRVIILMEIAVATKLGTQALAANQVVMSIWTFAIYGLDALAMAAQILVGQASGSGHKDRVRLVLSRCLRRGLWIGTLVGTALICSSPFIPMLMTSDSQVRWAAMLGLFMVSFFMPLISVAFILDGVLMGADDMKALAFLMLIPLLAFAPVAGSLYMWGKGADGFMWLWGGYAGVCMGARALATYLRVRTDAWITLGT